VLLEIARSYGLGVVEDATESLGASYRGARIGALADLSCFSFNGNKIITTGGGGMVVTNDKRLADRVRYLTTQAKDDPVEYVHNEIGFNYRLTNVQAALGVAQMEMLDNYVDIKLTIAVRYRAGLAALRGLTQPCEAKWARSSYWMYTVLVDRQSFGMDSRSLMARLSARRIQSRPLWHPLHRLLPFEKCQAYQIETADILYRDGLSLPCSVGLTEEEQQHVVRVIQG
jgi:perosamine synthetase